MANLVMGDSELTPSEVLDLESDGINNKVSAHCLPPFFFYCATVCAILPFWTPPHSTLACP